METMSINLTLLARAGYEAILNSMKGETDETDKQTAKKAHSKGQPGQRSGGYSCSDAALCGTASTC